MRYRSDLPKVRFRISLSRPIQLGGGDRRLVITGLMFGVYLGFVGTVGFGVQIGVPIGAIVTVAALRGAIKAGKEDPYFLDVMLRHSFYRRFYPARGRFSATARQYKDYN